MDKTVMNKFADAMLQTLQAAKDFTLEQAPDIMHQVIAAQVASTSYWAVLGLVGAAVSILGIKGIFNGEPSNGDGEALTLMILFLSIIFATSTIVGLSNVHDLIMVSVAPKLYLIEYFTNMVKQ